MADSDVQPMLIADVLEPGLRVIFCSTALGKKSHEARAYYANPTNKFWRMLFATGMTPVLLAPADYRKVLDDGIGLTDLCKFASGNDHQIPKHLFDPAGTRKKFEKYSPAFVAFTSKTAARIFLRKPQKENIAYGLQAEKIGSTQLFVLPSPSGAGSGYWMEDPWHELAAFAKFKRKKSA